MSSVDCALIADPQWGSQIASLRDATRTLQFKIQNDALYVSGACRRQTLRVSGAFALAIRGLALSVGAASPTGEAMLLAKPLVEKALRCANKIQN